jgi:hypothetical protein
MDGVLISFSLTWLRLNGGITEGSFRMLWSDLGTRFGFLRFACSADEIPLRL